MAVGGIRRVMPALRHRSTEYTAIDGCWRLLAAVGGCWRLLAAVGGVHGCWRLLAAVGGCWRRSGTVYGTMQEEGWG